MNKIIYPITFIDKLVKKNELGQPFTLMDHQREVLRLAFDFDQDGKPNHLDGDQRGLCRRRGFQSWARVV